MEYHGYWPDSSAKSWQCKICSGSLSAACKGCALYSHRTQRKTNGRPMEDHDRANHCSVVAKAAKKQEPTWANHTAKKIGCLTWLTWLTCRYSPLRLINLIWLISASATGQLPFQHFVPGGLACGRPWRQITLCLRFDKSLENKLNIYKISEE